MKNFEKYKTADDRLDAFHSFCDVYAGGCDCTRCPISKEEMCDCVPTRGFAFWLDLEAKEKPLPCPFCGGETVIYDSSEPLMVECKNCDYSSKGYDTITEAIAAHNRVAKAVIDAQGRQENG